MAVVQGSLALVLEMNSRRTAVMDRKTRPVPVEVLLSLFRKEPHHHISAASTANIFDSDKDNRIQSVGSRGKSNSKVNAGNFPGLSDDDINGNGNGKDEDEVEAINWEEALRKRVEELQEMKELEGRALELQNRIRDDDDEGNELTEEEKMMRVKIELEKVAKEQAERRKTAQLMFKLGQKAYGKGMYGRSIEFLEGALTIIPRPTLFGGEIQIWLAMAYDANNRHKDCISLYRQLETTHPSLSIRRQAADLRYISQAPKLKISQEEMVTIPYIGSIYDSYAGTWSDKYKDRDQRRFRSTTNQLPSTKDYLGDFLVWRPPSGLEKNQVFWVALTAWLGLVGAALFLQR